MWWRSIKAWRRTKINPVRRPGLLKNFNSLGLNYLATDFSILRCLTVRARPKLYPVDSVRRRLLQTGRFQGLNTTTVLKRTRDLVAREDAKCVITFNVSIIVPSGYLPAMVSFAAFSKSNHQPSITRKLLPTKYSYRATDSWAGRPNLSHNRKRSPSGACKGIL